jgi:hypothetical protein
VGEAAWTGFCSGTSGHEDYGKERRCTAEDFTSHYSYASFAHARLPWHSHQQAQFYFQKQKVMFYEHQIAIRRNDRMRGRGIFMRSGIAGRRLCSDCYFAMSLSSFNARTLTLL